MDIDGRTFRADPHTPVHPAAGNGSGDWNKAIECWAQVFARASLEIDVLFSRNEWNFLADMLQNVKPDPTVGNPGEYLPAHVMDAAWADSLGTRWLDQNLGESVQRLSRKVGRLDYVQAWALITACAWRWSFHAVINRSKDAWWTLAFRKEKPSKLAREKLAPDGLPVSYIRDGYWWIWFPGNGKRNRGRRA